MKEDFAEQCLHKDFPNIATLKQGLIHGVLAESLRWEVGPNEGGFC